MNNHVEIKKQMKTDMLVSFSSETLVAAFQRTQCLLLRQANEDVVVVDFDHGLLDVGYLVNDALVRNTTIQRIAKGSFVRLYTTNTIVVVFVHGNNALIVDVLFSISDSHQQSELHALLVTLRQEKSVGDTSSTRVPFKVLVSLGKGLERGDVRDGDGGL